MIDLNALTVTTTSGDKFTGLQHANMAWLIYRRFGNDMAAAAAAWRRMMENSTPDHQFEELVGAWIDYSLDRLLEVASDED